MPKRHGGVCSASLPDVPLRELFPRLFFSKLSRWMAFWARVSESIPWAGRQAVSQSVSQKGCRLGPREFPMVGRSDATCLTPRIRRVLWWREAPNSAVTSHFTMVNILPPDFCPKWRAPQCVDGDGHVAAAGPAKILAGPRESQPASALLDTLHLGFQLLLTTWAWRVCHANCGG